MRRVENLLIELKQWLAACDHEPRVFRRGTVRRPLHHGLVKNDLGRDPLTA
jgi:hypothetical protein